MISIVRIMLALLLCSCALNPGSYPLYMDGKRMALIEGKPDSKAVALTVFDRDGNRIYSSDFLGGCNNIPQAGKEIIGTRYRYDKEGNFQSRWEIEHDTVRAVYTEKVRFLKSMETIKYIYRRKNLDSIVFVDDSNRVSSVLDFGGRVCINLSAAYINYLNGFFIGYDKGNPFLYDTLLLDTYYPATGKLQSRIYRSPDSTLETAYFKSGKVSRKFQCAVEDNEGCKINLVNEWFENGRKSAEENSVGSHIVHRHYFEGGGLSTESFYIGTKLDSTYRSWHENGALFQRIEYALGQELKSEEWDEKGKKTK